MTNIFHLLNQYRIRNITNAIEGNGARVDIHYRTKIDFDNLNLYEKSHLKRYEFANNFISNKSICADFACGTGYGSALLAAKAKKVIGIDKNRKVVEEIKKRYKKYRNIEFIEKDLLKIDYHEKFNFIISFETIEHFSKNNINKLFKIFYRALVSGGVLIFSTPYKQKRTREAIRMGFHKTFEIDERKIQQWTEMNGFKIYKMYFQNYQTHIIKSNLQKKDFIICICKKT